MSTSNKQVLGVVYSQEDFNRKLSQLNEQGYVTEEIHAVAENTDHLNGDQVEVEKAGGFGDKMKSFVTGKSAVKESIDSLGLSEAESQRYTEDVAKGGILLYVEGERKGIMEQVNESEGAPEQEPTDAERRQYIQSVDNNYDEQEDRFARGETFLQDPTLVKDERHVSFTTQEKPEVEKARGGTSKTEAQSKNDRKYR
ncbi:general stress protein [Planococcus maritimus]|uniref:General stress protein n=1 Tax=Planococcus maritimus TaxID=192421 RepID=A0A7D7RDG4_PLAMR|nr:general stress protein [Planococcus maritimus]QMT16540.1 general stress protein [Planococcus maritimus]